MTVKTNPLMFAWELVVFKENPTGLYYLTLSLLLDGLPVYHAFV